MEKESTEKQPTVIRPSEKGGEPDTRHSAGREGTVCLVLQNGVASFFGVSDIAEEVTRHALN